MSRLPEPLFLARRSYRRRRLADGLRLLPVLGAILVLFPVLWRSSGGVARTVSGGLYVFAVWLVLIVLAAVLSRRMRRFDHAAGEEGAEDGMPGPGGT